MRILGFGTYDVARHPRVGVILEGLRAHGDAVSEINAPLGFSTAERVAMLGKPWTAYRLLLRLGRRWATLVRASVASRRRGHRDAVVVGYLGHFDVVLARLLFPRDRIVLDQMIFAADTAIDRGVKSTMKVRLLRLIDWVAITCADLVLLDAEEQRALVPARQRGKALVVAVGSPQSWFDAAPDDDARAASSDPEAPLRVVFVGVFTPLHGAAEIGEALAQLAGHDEITVTMIGKGQDWERTRALAADNNQVSWHEWIDADELTSVVASHDVSLGIFGTTPKAQRVVPNKVYQGAAAGCAIVTSDTPPQRRAFNDAAVFVPAGDPTALANALVTLAKDRESLDALRRAGRQRAVDEFTPAAIVTVLRDRLMREPHGARPSSGEAQ